MSLESTTRKVKELAQENAGRLGTTVKFEFPEGIIFLDDSASESLVDNTDRDASLTIHMQLHDFNKLISGDLDPIGAFMSGMMKIDGDMNIATKLTSFF